MPLRDLALILLITGLVPLSVLRPFTGLLAFSWLAYFRPQDLCWGPARHLPLSLILGGSIVVGFLCGRWLGRPFTCEPALVRLNRSANLLTLFFIAVGMSAVLAVHPDLAGPETATLAKVVVIALLCTGLVTTRTRVRLMVGVIALSFGAMALKHSLSATLSGSHRILTGPGGMIGDGNDFALALVMALPLLLLLAFEDRRWWLKGVAITLAVAVVAAVFYTQSRGAVLALGVITIVGLLKLRRRYAAVALAPVLLLVALILVPSSFAGRLRAVIFGAPDPSAGIRVIAWEKAMRMTLEHPVFGVGPANFVALWDEVEPRTLHDPIVVHNTFLEILVESGPIALLLYIATLIATVAALRSMRTGEKPRWRVGTSHALELSIIAFGVGALFLSRARFDLLYQLIGLSAALGMASGGKESVALMFAFWKGREASETARSHTAS